MNVYFACSITGGREFESTYQQIVAALTEDGNEIPTSHLAQSDVIQNERELMPQDVYKRDATWIKNCDALIAEVSAPSLQLVNDCEGHHNYFVTFSGG
jgi:hypothetical protein